MRRFSPYNYAFDNPLRFIDPDGMAPNDIIYVDGNGKEITRVKQPGSKTDTYIRVSSFSKYTKNSDGGITYEENGNMGETTWTAPHKSTGSFSNTNGKTASKKEESKPSTTQPLAEKEPEESNTKSDAVGKTATVMGATSEVG